MAVDRKTLVRALLRVARLEAAAADPVTTAKALLETLMRGQWTTVNAGGKQVISTTQAGRAVTWAVVSGLSAPDVMALAEAAWTLDDELGDAAIPVRRIRRLRIRPAASAAVDRKSNGRAKPSPLGCPAHPSRPGKLT